LSDQSQQTEQDFPFSDDSSISEEDRKDIVQQIDAVARENKIQVNPELFQVQAGSGGGFFPLLVNGIGLVVLVGGLAAGITLFRQSEQNLASARGTFKTAEGRLIEEVRKQTEAELQAKDEEITSMQSRLADVERERDQILAEIESRVMDREEELRQQLIAELDAERQRLLAAGQSQTQIESRLTSFEEQRRAEIAREIAAYRQQLEVEWERQLAGLKTVQAQYEQSLAELEQERLSISEESERRQAELRQELAAQSAAAEQAAQASERAQAEAEAARVALEQLATQVEQRSLVESQINGLYTRIAQQVRSGDHQAALDSLGRLSALLDDPKFVALPGVAERVRIDRFLTQSLRTMIEDEINEREIDISAMAEAATLLQELRTRVNEARTLVASGQNAQAEAAFREALQTIPAVAEAYGYLVERREALEADRLVAFQSQVQAAESSASAGSLTEAIQNYALALSIAGPDSVPQQEREAAVAATGSTANVLVRRTAENADARARAETEATWRQIVARQTQEWEQRSTREAEQAAARARAETAADYERRLAAIEQRQGETAAEYEQRLAEAAAAAAAAGVPVSSPEAARLMEEASARIDSGQYEMALQAYLSVLRRYPDSTEALRAVEGVGVAADGMEQESENALNALRARNEELASTAQTLRQEIDQLQPYEEQQETLRGRYSEYAQSEDRILQAQGTSGLAEAKLTLDSFLTSRPFANLFPGLWDRVQRYHSAFEQEGRESAILETIDIVFNVTSQDTVEEKQAFLDAEAQRNSENELLRQFIDELRYLVEEN
jgi:hypothetical protein